MAMKYRLIMLGLIAILAVSLLACSSETTGENGDSSQPTKRTTSYAAATSVEFYTCNEFEKNKHITDEITFTVGKGVTVILCSNRSTGFQWGEEAEISDTSVIEQTGHSYTAPAGDKVGAAGQEKFVFTGVGPGTATAYMEYSRPGDSGAEAEWTCTLTITVK